jgi:hypothetical protein
MSETLIYYLIAAIVLSIALAPKPVVPHAATIEDFEFPQAEEGTPQAVVFGDVWISGWMVLSYGNLRAIAMPGDDSSKS